MDELRERAAGISACGIGACDETALPGGKFCADCTAAIYVNRYCDVIDGPEDAERIAADI